MRYKLMGRSGLRVSELCLGTMTFGEEWGWGASKDVSRNLFNAFVEAGGNFVDTANRYTEGTSERWLGEFIAESKLRNKMVLATKYSLHTAFGDVNDGGNHRKNLVQSVEGSLSRLQTDYIDVLYLHAWDFTTPVDEVLRGLDDLVRAGKVLYIAISDTPAWVVSYATAIAELRGWSRFIGLQIEYSLIQRTPERDLIPMAKELDIAVTAWAVLAGGALTGKYLQDNGDPKRLKSNSQRLNERNTLIAREVVRIAKEIGCSPAQVAINWVRSRMDVCIPVIGARKLSQLKDNLDCLSYSLTPEHIARLDEVSKIDLGFPHDFLQKEGIRQIIFGGMYDKIDNHRKK